MFSKSRLDADKYRHDVEKNASVRIIFNRLHVSDARPFLRVIFLESYFW